MQKKLKQKEMWVAELMPSEWVEWQVSFSWPEDGRWSWRPGGFRLELALASRPSAFSLSSLAGSSVFLHPPHARTRIK